MIKLISLINESSWGKNRYKRIGISQKLVVDRYLEPVKDACAELAYRINNNLKHDLLEDNDILSAVFGTNGTYDDVYLRIVSVTADKLLEYRGYSYDDESRYPSQWQTQEANKISGKAVTMSKSDDTIGVIAKNIPLLRRLESLESMINADPSEN